MNITQARVFASITMAIDIVDSDKIMTKKKTIFRFK